MTHCSAEGLSTPHPHHTHTHTQAAGMIRGLANEHRRAAMFSHKNTHMQPRAYIHKHVYGVISRSGTIPLVQTHTHTHTHTHRARRPDGITAWAVGLSHSGGLDFSPFLLLFPGPLSSPPSSHLTSSPLLSLIFVSASSPRSHLLRSFLSDLFICSSICAPFHSANNT